MNIEIINKNIIDALMDGEVSAILHGCNTMGRFGSGLALEIKNRLPHAYEDYIAYHKEYRVKRGLSILGNCNMSTGPHGIVFNCFTQEFYGREKKKYVDDAAILSSLHEVRTQLVNLGLTNIGIPYMFCCGLGGGDWAYVMSCIEKVFKGFSVKIYNL